MGALMSLSRGITDLRVPSGPFPVHVKRISWSMTSLGGRNPE